MREARKMPVYDLPRLKVPYTDTAKSLKTVIASSGHGDWQKLKNKLDIYLLYDRITISEYKELYEIIEQKQLQETLLCTE